MVGFQGESPADRLPGQPCAHWREKQESPGAQEKGRFATGALF